MRPATQPDALEREVDRVAIPLAWQAEKPAQRAHRAAWRQRVPEDRAFADEPAGQLDQAAQAAETASRGSQQWHVVHPEPALVRHPGARQRLDQRSMPSG